MDDQATNRAGGRLRTILWWCGIIAFLVVGKYAALRAAVAVELSSNDASHSYFGVATLVGLIAVVYIVAFCLIVRRLDIRFRFTIRDLLFLLTVVAVALGTVIYALNKE